MIGDTFSVHFVAFRYLLAGLVAGTLWWALRQRSVVPPLLGMVLMGGVLWLFTWLPLQQPYGLQPGSPAAFELATVTSGAASGRVDESWIAGRRSPRPAWSFLVGTVAGRDVPLVQHLHELAPLILLGLAPLGFFFAMSIAGHDRWEAATAAFAAVFASSLPLDVFRPFGLVFRTFFIAPYRAAALLVAVLALAICWRAGRRGIAIASLLLGLVGWIDLTVLLWALVALVSLEIVEKRLPRSERSFRWIAIPIATLIALPQCLAWLRGDLLVRGPSPDEAVAYRLAFRDLFTLSADMEWIFVLAVLAVPLVWRRGNRLDRGLVSLVVAAYALWGLLALTFSRGLYFEPDGVFHLLRISVAILAGVGGYHAALWLGARLETDAQDAHRAHRWWSSLPAEPRAFALVVLFLLPQSAVFLWHPLRVDPLYYPSFQYPADTSIERLQRWLLAQTDGDEIVLTGNDTGEWVAALTGRRVLSGIRVLPREDRRSFSRELRQLFLSGDPVAMRRAVIQLGFSVIVLDPSLREVYWQLDEAHMEASGVVYKVHQIGDRYSIYRVR
ncbi:MAG TPA: hypothetical protein VEK15_32110 [Vicinamibacteria bacterium]|nr:hypothetical protein [Vicinamibacteria bacterium]